MEHELPARLEDGELFNYAAELADDRLAALGVSSESLEDMRSPPFSDSAGWLIKWQNSSTRKIELDRRGRFVVDGVMYTLLPTTPVTFQWPDGTVQTLEPFENNIITWTTSNDDYPKICWHRRGWIAGEGAEFSDLESGGGDDASDESSEGMDIDAARTALGLDTEYNELHSFILDFFVFGHLTREEGLTIQECIEACDIEGATEDAIHEAIEFLTSEGELYSTIDNDHFLATRTDRSPVYR